MRNAIISVLHFVIAAGAGAFLAHAAIGSSVGLGREKIDGWLGAGAAGATDADPWTRAVIAKVGLMALNRSETIYFSRSTDDNGARLRENCVYELTGQTLPTRWWSITLYADDNYLAQNDDGAHSVDATRVEQAGTDIYRVRIAPNRNGAANWLSSTASHAPILLFRMYHPDPAYRDDQTRLDLPEVKRIGCEEEPS